MAVDEVPHLFLSSDINYLKKYELYHKNASLDLMKVKTIISKNTAVNFYDIYVFYLLSLFQFLYLLQFLRKIYLYQC